MLRNGRPINDGFEQEEKLYRRCVESDRDPEYPDRIQNAKIQFPDMSVNRSKYSEVEDVKLAIAYKDANWDKYGVYYFKVEDIPINPPPHISKTSPTTWSWAVSHVPYEANYAHSEVRTYKNGNYERRNKPPPTIKKWFRMVLAEKTQILIEPKV